MVGENMSVDGEITRANKTVIGVVGGLLITILSGYVGYRLKDLDRVSVQVAINSERLTRLEMIVRNLPETLASQGTMLTIIDKKLDRHMENEDRR